MKKMFSWQSPLSKAALPLVLLASLFALQHNAKAETKRLIFENADSALTKEEARQQKEQWDETRRLRAKVNQRREKDFDKSDRALDSRDACEQSLNFNAYWEPNTLRCLDRTTGRPVIP